METSLSLSFEKGESFIPLASSKCLFSAELSTLASVERCLWCEPKRKSFFSSSSPSSTGERNGTERLTEWGIFAGFEKGKTRKKNWKIFMMLMVSGALWFRLNILGIHSSPPHRPQNDSGSDRDVKNAETFFYFSNLYPFSLKQATINHMPWHNSNLIVKG